MQPKSRCDCWPRHLAATCTAPYARSSNCHNTLMRHLHVHLRCRDPLYGRLAICHARCRLPSKHNFRATTTTHALASIHSHITSVSWLSCIIYCTWGNNRSDARGPSTATFLTSVLHRIAIVDYYIPRTLATGASDGPFLQGSVSRDLSPGFRGRHEAPEGTHLLYPFTVIW